MLSPGVLTAVGLLLLPHVSFVSGQEPNMDNIALRGTCRQSSMHKYNGDHKVPKNCTAAINNNTGTTYTADNCIHTLPNNDPPTGPFWTVQWDREHTIQQITVHARTGQLRRMRAMEVKVDNTTVYTFPADFFNINVVTQITPGLTGSKLPRSGSSVTLSRNRTRYGIILNFCEVQVWGCQPGKYGPQCIKDCGHCAGGAVCDSSSGHCPGECQQGWQPPLCDGCSRDYYGEPYISGCSKKCSDGCKDERQSQRVCRVRDGYCMQGCTAGRHGHWCEKQCGQCDGNGACDRQTGSCTEGCMNGWKEHLCNECATGFYGKRDGSGRVTQCAQCGDGCVDGRCDDETGRCPCNPGYMGPKCDAECEAKKWGQDCGEKCGHCNQSAVCNHENGHCPSGCVDGYLQPLCQECQPGRYGPDCRHTCGRCEDGRPCNTITGHCHQCPQGFIPPLCQVCKRDRHGDDCDLECSSECNEGWSADSTTCDSFTGHCLHGCKLDKHGPTCSKDCGHCANGAVCDSDSGECPRGCEQGWAALSCKACKRDYYGSHGNASCSMKCSDGCRDPHGSDDKRVGHGSDDRSIGHEYDDERVCSLSEGHCLQGCKAGRHGRRCDESCGHCADPGDCHQLTAYCRMGCRDGWKRPLCHECQPGRYGPDCRHTCGRCEDGGPCNTITGHCHQCPHGFQHPLCQIPAAHHDVTCGTMDMSFFISISDLEFKPENVTLSDPRCHVHTTPSRLSGRTPLNACGTSLRLTNDSLIFSNFLILPPAAQPEGDNASVSSNLQRVIPVECHYDRVSELRLSYLPMMRQILFTETGVGQFQFHIEQFRDASFASRIADSAYPLKVTVEERVFLQLSLGESVLDEADGGKDGGPYGMEVETCVSSSSSSMMAVRNDSSQELVRDSCPANPDVRLIANSQWQNASQKSSGPHHYFRFSFKPTIDSLEDGGGKKSSSLAMGLAYIHCRVRLCAAHSCQHPVDCAPPAPSSSASGSSSGSAGRVKRAAVISELEDRERRSATGGHHLSTGPLLIMKDTDETPKSAPSPLSSPVVVALGAVAGMTTLIAVSVIVAWVLTRSRQDQYDLTTAHPCHQ